MPVDQSLHTIEDVCNVFQCSKSTVWRWVAAGSFPKPLKFGGTSRWTDTSLKQAIHAAESGMNNGATPTSAKNKLRRPKHSQR